MKRNGNTSVNRTYNPSNAQPSIPLDVDEVDAVLEKYIRQKYDQQAFLSGNARPPLKQSNTGSTRSSEDLPPPLPPKPEKRFGFGLRSASSALPLHRHGPTSPPRSPHAPNEWGEEPIRVNKQSRVFGASVGGNNDNMDAKLAQLREMGFMDEKRNINVLKSLGGNLERTIESLIRLGEGASSSRSKTPIQPQNSNVNREQLPSTVPNASVTNGVSFANTNSISQTNAGSTGQQSSQGSAAQPQQQPANAGSINPTHSYQQHPQFLAQPNNPFDPSNDHRTRMASMDQAFSSMQISPQPLFPNATGGYPNQPPPIQDARLQTMTPPASQLPIQYNQSNPYVQQNQIVNSNHNPFNRNTHQSTPISSNPYSHPFNQQTNTASYNPFLQTSTLPSPQMPYSTDSPQTYSPDPLQGQFQQPSHLQPHTSNHQQSQQPLFYPQHSFTNPVQHETQRHLHSLQPQQTGRLDKSSILALYNYPQLAPTPLSNEPSKRINVTPDEHLMSNISPNLAPQRSATMPIQSPTGSRNPFQSTISSNSDTKMNPPSLGRHVSQESVDIGGFQSGRHSPDAFASLSARFHR